MLKSQTKTINMKYHLQHGMKSLSYLMGCIMYQIFKIKLNISLNIDGQKTENHSTRIYLNKTVHRITIKIETGY